jgi:hypothetical protein
MFFQSHYMAIVKRRNYCWMEIAVLHLGLRSHLCPSVPHSDGPLSLCVACMLL